MKSEALQAIEKRLDDLSIPEQRWLIDQLTRRMQQSSAPDVGSADLAAMAADPEIQRELRAIEAEFAGTEADGLERL